MSRVTRLIAASGAVLMLQPFEGGSWAMVQAGGGWMFATVDRPSDAGTPQLRPESPPPGAQQAEHHRPQERPGHIFGYPTRQDPLFDSGTRLPYEHQHLQRPQWNRPHYGTGLPQYVKPSRAQEPIRKPMYHVPLAAKPLDNKPKYTIKNYMAPSVSKPSYEFPTYMDRPNYVIKPIERPAYDRPAYDHWGVFYGRPAYNPPVYTPEEYKPPRYAPPPLIAPPR